jgi:hypothetical protein
VLAATIAVLLAAWQSDALSNHQPHHAAQLGIAAAIVAGCAFLAVPLLEGIGRALGLESASGRLRAASRRIGGEAWRYIQCIPLAYSTVDSTVAVTAYGTAIAKILDPPPAYMPYNSDDDLTEDMNSLRGAPPDAKRDAYIRRLADAIREINKEGAQADQRRIVFQCATGLLYLLGLVLVILNVSGIVGMNLPAIVSAMIGAVASLLYGNRYQQKAESARILSIRLKTRKAEAAVYTYGSSVWFDLVRSTEEALEGHS